MKGAGHSFVEWAMMETKLHRSELRHKTLNRPYDLVSRVSGGALQCHHGKFQVGLEQVLTNAGMTCENLQQTLNSDSLVAFCALKFEDAENFLLDCSSFKSRAE